MSPDEGYEESRPASGPELSGAWQTAIGLQYVDGLKTSEYLASVANESIAGKYDIYKAQELIKSYYEIKGGREKEADIAASGIARSLSEESFGFSPGALFALHGSIFNGVFEHAGHPRIVNLKKKEWVLRGDTVRYTPYDQIVPTLEYEFGIERDFDYRNLPAEKLIDHVAHFVSSIWQVHPFREGNTRTVAVFLIKYLRKLGFEVNNEPFAQNSWYFRNALVRSQYDNISKGIRADFAYLNRFLENAIYGAENELKNRNLLIRE